jgi:hypothetical protein
MPGKRKALIVASDEYEHDGLRHLPGPAADAAALGGVLGDPRIGDFAVQVMHNESAHIIQEQIEEFLSESRPEDVLLLHFSCHGLKSESGELFLATRNTRPNRLASTAIPASFIQHCMRTSRARSIVLLLDCCYGGAFSRGVTVRAAGDVQVLDAFTSEKLGGGRGRAVITASSAMEYAFEGDRLADDHSPQPSVFTRALVDGLTTGDADQDEDGWVSLNELYDYVFDKVRQQNPHQTPSRDVEMQGDLYVARSGRQRIRAAPLPPDLDAARKDPNMFARRGAVGELRSRLLSDNLPAAAGAWEALTELTNDIKSIADEAKSALREATVHPAETELRFGQLMQGSSPPHQVVHLLGPPIARACRPDPTHAWIHVTETAEGFDVSVRTSQAGTLEGRLNIKGPVGEAAVTIKAEIVPAPSEPSAAEEAPVTQTPLPHDQLDQPHDAVDDSMAQSRWTAHLVHSSKSTRSWLIQLSHDTHTVEIRMYWNFLIVLDGKVLLKESDFNKLKGPATTFSIPDGQQTRSAAMSFRWGWGVPKSLSDVRLAVDNRLLYDEQSS